MASFRNPVVAIERFRWVAGGLSNPDDAAIVHSYAAEIAMRHGRSDCVPLHAA